MWVVWCPDKKQFGLAASAARTGLFLKVNVVVKPPEHPYYAYWHQDQCVVFVNGSWMDLEEWVFAEWVKVDDTPSGHHEVTDQTCQSGRRHLRQPQ